jgi:pimeloyl-ACP methyl ester carboxylesterase
MAATLLPASAQARTPHVNPDAPTVVLVHGAFADASSWDKVVARLQKRGLPVMTVDNPLTSLADDVAATQRAIAAAPGKVVLVGHSWGGTVITQAGRDPKVSALVYVAAFAPEVGQNSAQQGEGFPVAPGLQKLVESGGFLSLSAETVASDFAQDLKPAAVREVFAHQLPLKASALSEPVDFAAWQSLPSWYVVSRKDRMLSPKLQVATAQRIGAQLRSVNAGHVSPLSEPREVSDAILEAAGLKQVDPALGSDGG